MKKIVMYLKKSFNRELLTLKRVLLIVGLMQANMGFAESNGVKPFNGQQYFEGVVFKAGPVADHIPAIEDHLALKNQLSKKDLKVAMEQFKVIEALIAQKHPEFFSEFAQAMESKDHITIQAAIQNGYEVAYQAADEMVRQMFPEIGGLKEMIGSEIGTGSGHCAAVVLAAAAYVAAVHGVVIHNVAALNAAVYATIAVGSYLAYSDHGSFANDVHVMRMVDQIATNF